MAFATISSTSSRDARRRHNNTREAELDGVIEQHGTIPDHRDARHVCLPMGKASHLCRALSSAGVWVPLSHDLQNDE